MTLNQFVAKNNGKAIDFDGYYGAQCWDLAAFYDRDVVKGKGMPTGNGCACGCYKNFLNPLPKFYKRIPHVKGNKPVAGDLIIWNCNLPNSGGCGHIAVVLSSNKTSFVSFDQNWGGKYCHKVVHDYRYVIGYLRPRKNIEAVQTKTPKPITYKVKKGDYLYKIAGLFKTTVGKLRKLNPQIKDPNKIKEGQKIRVK